MAGGRPTIQTPELEVQAREYIENYAEHDHAMPSIVGMSIVIKVTKSTLYDWAKLENNEFTYILAECMAKQELTLFNNGLNNTFNAAITKLALGKHGYHDKQDNTLSAPDGGPVGIQEITFNPVGSDD